MNILNNDFLENGHRYLEFFILAEKLRAEKLRIEELRAEKLRTVKLRAEN